MADSPTRVHRVDVPEPLDFTRRMRRLCDDMIARLPDALGHIEMRRVALSFRQARNGSPYGVYATLTPLRFPGGAAEAVRRGRRWRMPRLLDADGQECLYVLNFYLPRFLDLNLQQKLQTTAHELWHVHPQFNGDVRRFAGRCYAHSHSRKTFDAQAAELVERWMAADPAPAIYEFLQHDFQTLLQQYGRVTGAKIRLPRLVRA